MLNHAMIFNLGSPKVCSPAIIEAYFSYHKDLWIAATDHEMVFYIFGLFPLTAVLQLIFFWLIIFLPIIAVILLLSF